MPKNFWFKFEWNDWLSDEALSCCSLEAQGLWIRCLCFMYRSDVAELTGTIEQLRRKLGVLPEELMRCLQELKTNKAADVRFCKDEVSIISRRRQKDLKASERNRLYVAKHREKDECKTDVSIQSKSKSKSKIKPSETDGQNRDVSASPYPPDLSFKKPHTRSPATPASAELDTWLSAVAVAAGASDPSNLSKFSKWEKVCMSAIRDKKDLNALLRVIESEKERTKGQEQFFSPETCLQKLQLNGTAKQPSKWMHEV